MDRALLRRGMNSPVNLTYIMHALDPEPIKGSQECSCLPIQGLQKSAAEVTGVHCSINDQEHGGALLLSSYMPQLEMMVGTLVTLTLAISAMMLLTVRPYLTPPGPRKLPLLGNLYIFFRCQDLIELAASLRQRYGDVYSIFFGSKCVVIVNGLDAIKEAFLTKGDKLLNRPEDLGYERFTKNRGVMNTNGKRWLDNRRFIMTNFRHFGVGELPLHSTIQFEIDELVRDLSNLQGAPFEPRPILLSTTAKVIFKIILDKEFTSRYHPDLNMFIHASETAIDSFGILSLLNCMPFIERLPGDIFKINKMTETDHKIRSYMDREIEKRGVRVEETGECRCLTDNYLRRIQMDAQNEVQASQFDAENLAEILLELFVAGTDTTSTTLEWFILYLAMHPEEQEKLFREIDTVLDGEAAELVDRLRLPYLNAALQETQRLANVTPFSVPRTPSEDIQLVGCTITKGTLVVPSFASVMMDPELFPEPEKFKPARFLEAHHGKLRDMGFIPFSLGKRKCLGEVLAKAELLLISVAMLQHFRFVLPDDEPVHTLEGLVGACRKPKPFRIRALARN